MSKTIALENCVQILDNLRKPINSDERYLRSGNIPYYGANGQQGWIDDFLFDENLVLLAEDGGDFDNYHTKPIAYRVSGKSWVNNHAHVLKAIPEVLDNDYLYWALVHKNIVKFVSGGTRSKLNQSELRKIEIPYFSIEKQKKISFVLNKIEIQTDLTKDLIAKLNKKKRGLSNDLLTRGVDSHGNLRPSYDDAPDLYQETELGFIPKEWDAQKINAYLVSDAGIKPGPFGSSVKKEFYKADGFKIYGQEQVIAGNQHIGDYYISESKFNDLIDFAVKENDILISLVGTIGKVLRLSSPLKKGIINPRLMRLRPNIQLCNPNFLAILLASDFYVNQVIAKAGGGTMPVINKSIISSVSVPIIPIDEQMKIVEIYNGIDTKYKLEINNLKKLQKMKKGLLQDLLQN
ncbi:restriction endonuclease subunit S [Acinetobacter sp. YWS30-1]|uniref:restriction endonuclease subunit S n=1 Tax=Acinetobacter sp. YWS30-1 TaxID=2996862 RepID=UPI002B2633D3|nr:restriction endonuclease subunit S [Acinetobacter sp. YWS30-1]WPC35493.1 restriction endonuclease subunit S [Acinetobacter sp. YWS30-1]